MPERDPDGSYSPWLGGMEGEDDYAEATELDWVMYEFSTIAYDFRIHPEAARRIEELFKRLAK